MWFPCDIRTLSRAALGAAVALGLAAVALAATASTVPTKAPEATAPAPAGPPLVQETRANLQQVFAGELNVKERYLAAAKQASLEGYPYVAQLFRACARAEQAHADQHVHAIAAANDEARAMMQRLALGTTIENLKTAIGVESYEATLLYPALLAQARAEHMPAAVRSMNYALAAERQHAALFAAALASLDQRAEARTFYVCPQCGRTVESLDFSRCPNCFGSARKFVRIS